MNTPGGMAVVGCGAIADQYYLPAIAADAQLKAGLWLVDPSAAPRQAAIERFGLSPAQQASSIDELPATVVAAINATPSHLHVVTTRAMFARGLHVMLEKPAAETAADAQLLADEAASLGLLLGVNQFRRLGASPLAVKALLDQGRLGTIRRVSWAEGHKFDWPTQSGFYFRRPWNGRPRGVLLDIGVHVLDLLTWWLGTPLQARSAAMDSFGGPEAYVDAVLASGAIDIALKISFHADLENRFEIEGERASIRGSVADLSAYEIRYAGGGWRTVTCSGPADWPSIATALMANFKSAVAGGEALAVTGASVVAPLAAIDALYAMASDPQPACYKEWVA